MAADKTVTDTLVERFENPSGVVILLTDTGKTTPLAETDASGNTSISLTQRVPIYNIAIEVPSASIISVEDIYKKIMKAVDSPDPKYLVSATCIRVANVAQGDAEHCDGIIKCMAAAGTFFEPETLARLKARIVSKQAEKTPADDPERALDETETTEMLNLFHSIFGVKWIENSGKYIIQPEQFLTLPDEQYQRIIETLSVLHAAKEKGGEEAVDSCQITKGPLTEENRYNFLEEKNSPIKINPIRLCTLGNLRGYVAQHPEFSVTTGGGGGALGDLSPGRGPFIA